jgi:hypothetical protein
MYPSHIACVVCKSQGHSEANCPQLSEPLKHGFYSGGGGGGHSHEEEDD